MVDSRPIALVSKALALVQAELGGRVQATGTAKVPTKAGGSFSYDYVELDHLLAAAVPILSKHGIAILHTQATDSTTCYILHESGEYLTTTAMVGVTAQQDAQQRGSAYTYGRRYSLMAALALAAGDDDGAAAKAKPKAKESPKEKAARQAAHDPVFESGGREAFFASLAEAGVTISYDEIKEVCASVGRPKPSEMTHEQRGKLVEWLAANPMRIDAILHGPVDPPNEPRF